MALLAGVPFEALTTATGKLEKSLFAAGQGAAAQSGAFAKLGIDIKSNVEPATLFQETIEGLANIKDPFERIGIATQLFGRGVQSILPLINASKDQLDEYNEKLDEYGIKNDDAEKKGLALAEAFNENALAGKGLNNVFTQSLAPAFTVVVSGINELIKGFVQSYESGGDAKEVMDGVAWTAKFLADTIGLAGVVIDYTWKTIDGAAWMLAGVMAAVTDAITGAITLLIDSFKSFGDVARDALTLNWGAIAGDIKSGADRAAADVVNTTKKMGADAAAGFKKGADEWMAGDQDVSAYEAWSKKLWSGAGTQSELPKSAPAGNGGPGKPPKAGAGGDQDLPQIDTPQLIQPPDFSGFIAAWENATKIQVGLIQDTESAQRKSSEDQLKGVDDAEKQGLISAQQAAAQKTAIILQERSDALAAASQIEQIRLDADKKIMDSTDRESADFKKAQKDKEQAVADFEKAKIAASANANTQLIDNTRKEADEVRQAWDKSVGSFTQSFADGLLKMGQGTESFAQIVNKMAGQIETTAVNMSARLVSDWLFSETHKALITEQSVALRTSTEQAGAAQSRMISFETAQKEAFNAAVTAAASAYKAMAGIPIIGPELGVVAAGVTFAAVEAYGAMASAAGGYDIPSGLNPIVQTHAEEMILPAYIANPLRGMVQDYQQAGDGQGFGGSGAQAAPTHNYNFHVHTMDSQGVQSFFDNHAPKLVKSLNRAARAGAPKPAGW